MSNVLVDKTKLDYLANAISNKSGEALTLTLDEMVSAVDGIETGGGGGGITPTGNIDITSSGVTDVTNYATATVPSASFYTGLNIEGFRTENNARVWKVRGATELDTGEGDVEGWIAEGIYQGDMLTYNAIASGTTITPSTSSQTIGGANYMMEGAVTVSAMPSGSASAPSTISGTSASVSTGTNTLTLSKTVSVTPTVSAGYVSSGTATNSSVSLTANVTTKGATNHYATTSDQTIASGTYLTGIQTIKALSQTNLSAENIKSGTTITINNGNANVWSVTGTYSGGGGSSDIVTGTLNVASNVNTSTSTQITTTSAIGFTPTKFFFYKDARTATSNHMHQATFTTIGSYYIRTSTRYSNSSFSTSGNANNWTTQTAGYLYYNSNTIYFRSSSSYILSSGTWHWVAIK